MTISIWLRSVACGLAVGGLLGPTIGGPSVKPYQPNGVIKNDREYILLMRRGGEYRQPERLQKALSMLSDAEVQAWFRSSWSDIPGASTENSHPAPYPVALAERLIRLFSFVGDMVLDPFCGSGSTAVASISTGRNSVSFDIEHEYVSLTAANMRAAAAVVQASGMTSATVICNAPISAKRAGKRRLASGRSARSRSYVLSGQAVRSS